MSKRNYFQFINYFDVWGNIKEGYEVNNLCKEPIFISCPVGEYPSKADCLKALKKADFIKKGTRVESFYWSDFDTGYDMEEKKTLCPFGRLEPVKEEYFREYFERSSNAVLFSTRKKV